MTRRTTTTRVSRATALLAACALAASLASCGGSDPVQDEIDRVSVGLGAISTSGSTALPSVENRRAMYQWAIGRLTGKGGGSMTLNGVATTVTAPNDPAATDSKNVGQAAAANLLVARGYGGLGEISAQESALLEGSAAMQIPPISAALDQWLSQNAAADAFAAYNPAADIAEIEKLIGEKQKLADDARAGKDRQLANIADLEKQAEELMDVSRKLREQSAEVRGRATNVSETARLELITEAVRISREADQVEKQAAGLTARVDVEKPKADNLQRGIDELTTQIQLLRNDKDGLRQRTEQNAAAAKRAREDAQTAATRLTQMLGTLTAARESITGPTDAAVSAYTQAVKASNKAGRKGQAAIAAGNYQHALADVLATKARGLRAYADLLGALAGAKPALPGAADFATKAAAATELAKAAGEEAATAFDAALQQYSASGGSGDTQDRLDALKASMNALLGKKPETPAEETPAAVDAPEGEAAAVPPDATPNADLAAVDAEVRAALEQYLAASKSSDLAAIRGFVHADGETGAQALDAAFAPIRLNGACQTTYSKSLRQLIDESKVESIKSNPMIGGMIQMIDQFQPTPEQVAAMSPADAQIVAKSPTEAAVTFPAVEGAGKSINLKKVDGSWKVDLTSAMSAVSGANPMMATMLKSIGESFTKVTGKLTGGEYADADTMLLDLNKELLAAMMKAGGLGGPGGGGNGGGGGGPGGG